MTSNEVPTIQPRPCEGNGIVHRPLLNADRF